MAECLSLMHIGNVYFNERYRYTGKRIPQCDAGMGQSARIDNDGIHLFVTCGMDAVYQHALMITLESLQHGVGSFCLLPCCRLHICQRDMTVHRRLSGSEQVQVWSV